MYRPRLGTGAALQHGLEQCHTPFLARMDGDDTCTPQRIGRQLQFLESHPDVGAVGTQYEYFVDKGVSVSSQFLPLSHDAIHKVLLKGSMGLVAASMMFRTEDLRRCGGYKIQGRGEDWDMFLRLCEVATVANLPETLYWWRLHPGNLDSRRMITERFAIKYSIDCARARGGHRPEESFETFLARQTLTRYWATAIESRGSVEHRNAICAFARHRRLLGFWHLLIASLLCPWRAVRRMARHATGRMQHSARLKSGAHESYIRD